VVFLMAARPAGAWAVVIVIVGALIGIAAARVQLRMLTGAADGAAAPLRAETAH
jgi:hypothetical protein